MVGVGLAIVNAAKEKFVMALVALIFWPAAVASAIRLAKPHSLWARAFYGDERLARSRERYAAGAGSGPEPPSPSGSAPVTDGQSSS